MGTGIGRTPLVATHKALLACAWMSAYEQDKYCSCWYRSPSWSEASQSSSARPTSRRSLPSRSSRRSSRRSTRTSRSRARSRRRRASSSTCCSSASQPRACSRSTRTCSSPRRTPCGGRSSAATGSRSRSTRAPRSAGRPRSTARHSGSGTPTSAARSARSGRSAPPSPASTAGSPGSAATSLRRARGRRSSAGTSGTRSGRRARSRTGRTTTCGRTSTNATSRSTSSTSVDTLPSAARTARHPAPAARVAGPVAKRPNAACTPDPRPMTTTAPLVRLSHLDALESEAIHIMREVAAELERPVLLFSGGKDSIVLLRLAEKAFRPGRFPFPLMHIDTGHNFPEAIEFRDRRIAELGERLVIASVQESIDKGRVVDETGPRATRNRLQTTTLLDAMLEHGFDAAIGGARRDEERSRAKERIFSFRDDFGQWDPRAQRPELWNLYNGRIRKGEQVRVFPISNWTELDVWQYVARERLELPAIYFSHRREVFERDGMLYAASEFVERYPDEKVFSEWVRFRTVGDMSCTGGVRSRAVTIEEVVTEIAATRVTERGETRADDKVSEAAMEDRKRVGYF